jgi:hypothetical protein
MCLICGQPSYVHCNCSTPSLVYSPCPPNGYCAEKLDVSCVFYNLNNPAGQNNMLNLGLPNGVNLKTIIDQIDTLLGNSSGGGSSTPTPCQDRYVKVDVLDGSSGYLYNKLTAGNNVSFVVLNPGGNESIQINADNNKVSVDATDPPDYLINQISGSTDGIVTVSVLDQNGVVQLQPCIDVEALLNAILNIPNYQNLFCQLVSNCTSQVTPCNPPSTLTVSITGGSALLNWTPGGGTGTQAIEYKLDSSSSFISFGSVSATTATATITGLSANVTYDFRITNDCASGQTSTAIQESGIQINCPTVTVTPTQTSVTVSFPSLGGSITSYKVILLNAAGNTVITSKSLSGPFTSPVTTTFTGLTAGTTYNIQVQPSAETISNTTCALAPFTTTALATCTGPTNLTVVATNGGANITWTPDVTSSFQSLYYGLQSNVTGVPPGNGWTAFSGNPIPATTASATLTGLTPGATYSIALNAQCQNGTTTSYLQQNFTTPNTISAAISLINYNVPGNVRQVNTQVNIVFSQPTPVALTLYFGFTTNSTAVSAKYAVGWDLFTIPTGYVAQPAYQDITSNYPYQLVIPAGTTNFSTNTVGTYTINTTSIYNMDVPWYGFSNSTGFPVTTQSITGLWVKIANPSGYIANFTLTTPTSVPITNVNS